MTLFGRLFTKFRSLTEPDRDLYKFPFGLMDQRTRQPNRKRVRKAIIDEAKNQIIMSEPWESTGVVETYTGGGFDLYAPNPADVRLLDIAAGLAHICRFGGHCRQFYSVAHHSIHVSHELPSHDPRLQLIGLFHDAGEAYIGDIPRPLKAKQEALERMEEKILDAVWMSFDINPPTEAEWDTVMAADDRLLAYEANHLLEGGDWAEDSTDLGYDLHSDPIEEIRDQFLTRYEMLSNRLQ